jgi:hypothetical protein
LAGLPAAQAAGRLRFHGRLSALAEPATFAAWLTPLYAQEWVVHAKPPFGGPAQVLKYLARYTHRVALSNARLVSLEEGRVTFHYKDYVDDRRPKTLTLAAEEFLRRFLLHVLPRGFVKVRHYGLLANRYRQARVEECRRLLLVVSVLAGLSAGASAAVPAAAATSPPCPLCGGEVWQLLARVARPRLGELFRLPLGVDSS